MADADAPPTDDLVTTSHTLLTPAGELAYTATAGRIVQRTEKYTEGTFAGLEPHAEMFLVAYTLDGADPATRPVTVVLPGGPGSSTVWMHLGLFGPRRVVMGDAGALTPPPWGLADNAESLLAHSDLVFVDPVSAGYSRPVIGSRTADHHTYSADVDALAETVRLWITRNERWPSPKFVAGESYGTVRAVALAEHLQTRHGMYLNGLMLLSSALDFASFGFTEGSDRAYPLHVPTYAAIAHHHGLHEGRTLKDVLADAEDFASGDYPRALACGHRLPPADLDRVAARLAALTGLSEEYVRRVRLRVGPRRFFRELLRGSGRTVGRFDGRFTGWEPDDGGEHPSYDPSLAAITGPYTAALHSHVRTVLGYASDHTYEVFTKPHQWSFREFEGRSVSVVGKLSAAMRMNPHLRVHVACGYLDGATPYFAAEQVLAHLPIPDELRARIEVRYYEAGHMMYVHEPSRLAQSADLAAFVTAPSA